MRNLVLVLFLFLLTGCETMNPIGIAKGIFQEDKGLEVETELVVGDKAVRQDVQVGNRQDSKQSAMTIYNKINNTDPVLLLLLIIGWLLPSPVEIWRGFLRLLPWVGKNK